MALKICWISLSLVVCIPIGSLAEQRYVALSGSHTPPFTNWVMAATNIQAAVDVSSSGDVITVGPGVYRGAGNTDIEFGGRDLWLHSSDGAETTIIDAENRLARGLFFRGGETRAAVVEGITIRNGYATYDDFGGATINFKNGSSPTIRDCVFESSYSYTTGGALSARDAGTSPILQRCVFRNNRARWGATAIYANQSSVVTLENCLIVNGGAGGACQRTGGATIYMRGCTVAFNSGWGLSSYDFAPLFHVSNSIVWGNDSGGEQIHGGTNAVLFSACCVQNLTPFGKNIDDDPLFLNAGAENFSLSPNSPCIDAGSNESWMVTATDLAGHQRIQNGTVDMGAYESGFNIGIRFSAVDVFWSSTPGETYQVQWCNDLVTADWADLLGPITATSTSTYVVDWIRDSGKRYYRVIEQANP